MSIVCFSLQLLSNFPVNVITLFPNSYYTLTLQVMWGFPHSLPVKHIPCTFQWFSLNLLQALHVTCIPCKFETPADSFPCKLPVNPCKHLQCSVAWPRSQGGGKVHLMLQLAQWLFKTLLTQLPQLEKINGCRVEEHNAKRVPLGPQLEQFAQCEQSFNPALKIWFKIKLCPRQEAIDRYRLPFPFGDDGDNCDHLVCSQMALAKLLLEHSVAFMTHLLTTKQNLV